MPDLEVCVRDDALSIISFLPASWPTCNSLPARLTLPDAANNQLSALFKTLSALQKRPVRVCVRVCVCVRACLHMYAHLHLPTRQPALQLGNVGVAAIKLK